MSIIIIGGDGFCGWPTTLRFLKNKKRVTILDNLSRRKIDKKLSSNSLTPIASIKNKLILQKKFLEKKKLTLKILMCLKMLMI